MATPTLIDTDILIDAGRGVAEAVTCLNEIQAGSALAASVVTQMAPSSLVSRPLG
jgi:hypothetical protein